MIGKSPWNFIWAFFGRFGAKRKTTTFVFWRRMVNGDDILTEPLWDENISGADTELQSFWIRRARNLSLLFSLILPPTAMLFG